MEGAFTVIRDAILITLSGAIITGVYLFIKWLVSLARVLKEMENNGKTRKEEMQAVFVILKRLMDASKATLETLRDQRCNGNVSTALEGIEEASNAYEDLFLEKVSNR